MMNQILEWSQGNAGAIAFLTSLVTPENTSKALHIVIKLEEAKSIRGTNLYVLWSDLCEKDISKVEMLCKKIALLKF